MDDPREVLTIAKYEGLEIEEARLTYAARQRLPKSVFCGPDRTYPAQDAVHVRNGFVRLSTFGKRLDRAVALRIYHCLVRRAKKFGIDHDPSQFTWLTGKKSVSEALKELKKDEDDKLQMLYDKYDICSECETPVEETNKDVLQWFEEALWIAQAIKHKGALRKRLGIKEGEKIPISILTAIKNAEIGTTVSFRGKSIKVDTTLKRQAILALRLRKMPRRTK